jgi:lysophospholipase L1-like esterase
MEVPRMSWPKIGVKRLLAVSVALVFGVALTPSTPATAAAGHGPDRVVVTTGHHSQRQWLGIWSGAPAPPDPTGISHQGFNDQTIRDVVNVHFPGDVLRIRVANTFGSQPLRIGRASIGLAGSAAGVVPGTGRSVYFGGQASITVPVGAQVYSDPVRLRVAALRSLAVSLYLPVPTGPTTWHAEAAQTTYIASGDRTADVGASAFTSTVDSWFYLTGVSALAPGDASAVVCLGDSITDGAFSTVNANHRYPDFLAQRVLRRPDLGQLSVLNAGIGGNRILSNPTNPPHFGVNVLSRFDRDVLGQDGVHTVVFLEGINDIGNLSTTPVTAAELIAGMKQVIIQAHQKGLRILGGTLLPFQGTIYPGYYTPQGEAIRQEVNSWIRTSHAFDAVVDFDRTMRDPAHPLRLLPAYDAGDHLHPNDLGYHAMADSIRLELLASAQAPVPAEPAAAAA